MSSGQDLTAGEILDLHRIVTEDTLDDPADGGRLQPPSDERIGVYWHDGTLLHAPPPASDVRWNDEIPDEVTRNVLADNPDVDPAKSAEHT